MNPRLIKRHRGPFCRRCPPGCVLAIGVVSHLSRAECEAVCPDHRDALSHDPDFERFDPFVEIGEIDEKWLS